MKRGLLGVKVCGKVGWFWDEVQGLVIIVEEDGCGEELDWVWEVGFKQVFC